MTISIKVTSLSLRTPSADLHITQFTLKQLLCSESFTSCVCVKYVYNFSVLIMVRSEQQWSAGRGVAGQEWTARNLGKASLQETTLWSWARILEILPRPSSWCRPCRKDMARLILTQWYPEQTFLATTKDLHIAKCSHTKAKHYPCFFSYSASKPLVNSVGSNSIT